MYVGPHQMLFDVQNQSWLEISDEKLKATQLELVITLANSWMLLFWKCAFENMHFSKFKKQFFDAYSLQKQMQTLVWTCEFDSQTNISRVEKDSLYLRKMI